VIPKSSPKIPDEVELVATKLVDAAYHVHRNLGPGLLETVYEQCLAIEFQKRGVPFKRQVLLPIVYDGVRLENGFRVDLLVDECIVVELKAVEKVEDVHMAQLLTYLKLTQLRLGFLINFNVKLFREGIDRVAL
jgi:GxxExxY protein